MSSRRLSWARRVLTLLVFAGSALSIPGHSCFGETLKDVLSSTYHRNPKLEAARASQRATDEEVPRALSSYRPSVTGQATTGYQNTNGSDASSNGVLTPRSYSVSAIQPIFRGFRTVNAVNSAEATVRAGRETLRQSESTVLLEAVTAFGDVVRDQSIVSLRENNVAVLSKDLSSTQARFAAGEVTRTDVAQSQARRAAAVSALDLARANLATSRATFARVVGQPPGILAAAAEASQAPKTLRTAIEIALRENPNIVAALYREQAARFNIETIRGELLPTAQLEASYSKSFDTYTTTPETEQSKVTGRVTVPIYSGGEVEARVRQAKQTHVQRLQEIEQYRSEQQAQVVQAWSQLEAARAQLSSDKAGAEASRVALLGVRDEERVGQRTLLDVLNAEQELLNNRVNVETDRRNLLVASYSLLASIGRLNAQELVLFSAIYDSEAHYVEVRNKWRDLTISGENGSTRLKAH